MCTLSYFFSILGNGKQLVLLPVCFPEGNILPNSGLLLTETICSRGGGGGGEGANSFLKSYSD